jgi:hypothetical protein
MLLQRTTNDSGISCTTSLSTAFAISFDENTLSTSSLRERTPGKRVLPEKLILAQLVKKFLACNGT